MAKVKRAKKKAVKQQRSSKKLRPRGLYEQKYLFFLGVALLILLFVVGVKILASYASSPDGGGKPLPNQLGCAYSKIDNSEEMKKEVSAELYKRFGIDLQGNLGAGVDRPLQIYNTMCLIQLYYPKFFSVIGASGNKLNVTVTIGGWGKGCKAGITPRGTTWDVNIGWCDGSSTTYMAANRFVLVHELGHVMINRKTGVYNQYVSEVWWDINGKGAGEYPRKNSRWLKSWNCQNASKKDGTTSIHECFADMVGEFLVYNQFEHPYLSGYTGDYKNWPTNNSISSWYNFAVTNIFGGNSNGNFGFYDFGTLGPVPTDDPSGDHPGAGSGGGDRGHAGFSGSGSGNSGGSGSNSSPKPTTSPTCTKMTVAQCNGSQMCTKVYYQASPADHHCPGSYYVNCKAKKAGVCGVPANIACKSDAYTCEPLGSCRADGGRSVGKCRIDGTTQVCCSYPQSF